jgi:hypothetical protein
MFGNGANRIHFSAITACSAGFQGQSQQQEFGKDSLKTILRWEVYNLIART